LPRLNGARREGIGDEDEEEEEEDDGESEKT
jgi:hypothetical protein